MIMVGVLVCSPLLAVLTLAPHQCLVLADDIPHKCHGVHPLALLCHLTKLTLTGDVLDARCIVALVAAVAATAAML